jgi:predicted nucleic acid-binding Zn ribbon protein
MQPLQDTAARALKFLLDSQPTTPAKVAFAWTMAAGPAMSRGTEPRWRDDGVLIVRARSAAWLRELRRAKPILAARVRELVGADTVKRIEIEPGTTRSSHA